MAAKETGIMVVLMTRTVSGTARAVRSRGEAPQGN